MPPPRERLDLPVPKGQPQKGLRIPIHAPDGRLLMNFHIGIAELVDADHIKMSELHLETFNAEGELEFDIDLPDSVFNAATKELSSKTPVRIKRRDFEITGNSVTFNVEAKTGTFGNGVKMVIFDARPDGANGADDGGEKPVVPDDVKPMKEEKK